MDEVDNIIIHTLHQIESNIEDDVISLSNFTPKLVVETVSKCLKLIKPSLVIPETLPASMAQRFSATASLAEACKSIGYEGDVGYQTFLYTNVSEMRRVFMFLIEKLPKDTEKMIITQTFDKTSSLEAEIERVISTQLTSLWVPIYCNSCGTRKYDSALMELFGKSTNFQPQLNLNLPRTLLDDENETHVHDYWLKRSPTVFQKTNFETICPSIIHKNDIEEYKYSNHKSVAKHIQILTESGNVSAISPKMESLNIGWKQEIAPSSHTTPVKTSNIGWKQEIIPGGGYEELDGLIEQLKHSIGEHLSNKQQINLIKLKLQKNYQQNDVDLQKLKDLHKIKKKTFILLENPSANISKMEKLVANTSNRLENLREQWQEHQKPLLEILDNYKLKNNSKTSENSNIMKQVKVIQERSSGIAEDLRKKSLLYTQFAIELQKVDKVITRKSYTSRILEIIGNIRKQKNDIDNVLRDTRELQKEIQNITGQLSRQFAVTDDLLFKTAKRDEYSKRAYKLLVTLHEDCGDLIVLVEEIGSIMREIRDIEDQIENEKIRNFSSNLERITNDLKETEKESKELQEKIRQVENRITNF